MIGDTVDIKDAFIINIAVDFEIVTLPNFNSSEIIAICVSSIQQYFDINKWQNKSTYSIK